MASGSDTAKDDGAPACEHPDHLPQIKKRRRAPRACLCCRARKVRCDVSQRGSPCMNCYLDNEECVVVQRARYRYNRIQREERDEIQTSLSVAKPSNVQTETLSSKELMRSRMADIACSTAAEFTDVSMGKDNTDSSVNESEKSRISNPRNSDAPPSINSMISPRVSQASPSETTPPKDELFVPNKLFAPNHSATKVSTCMILGNLAKIDGCVPYSSYPFITLTNLGNVPTRDVNFLELEGCLHVPISALVEVFLEKYFLHIHPFLPIMDEGDIWDIWQNRNASKGLKMPLLLLRAILFASSNFISHSTLHALGYRNIRDARGSLYRRAKLLHDLEAESSPLVLAQASLLLSFWSPDSTKKSNTSWLGLAIQYARNAQAHRYTALPNLPTTTNPLHYRKKNTLKRLWWCCVIRDRMVALLMRRPIQITRAHFDFDVNSPIGCTDLHDEFRRSKVCPAETKRYLASLLEHLAKLCVILTDIITVVFPLHDCPNGRQRLQANESRLLRSSKTHLRKWYADSASKFPSFRGSRMSSLTQSDCDQSHNLMFVYTNFMYMIYHSSRVVLCHCEVLALTMHHSSSNEIDELDGICGATLVMDDNRYELQDAASGVAECVRELVDQDLARWLPISAIGLTALPLILNILDVKLAGIAGSSVLHSEPVLALKQRRLNMLIQAMKTYRSQYDEADWITTIIRHVVEFVQLNEVATSCSKLQLSDWTDMLVLKPVFYLRVSLALDLSLSEGRLPEDDDFPAFVRGLSAADSHILNSNEDGGSIADKHFEGSVPAVPKAIPLTWGSTDGDCYSGSQTSDQYTPPSNASIAEDEVAINSQQQYFAAIDVTSDLFTASQESMIGSTTEIEGIFSLEDIFAPMSDVMGLGAGASENAHEMNPRQSLTLAESPSEGAGNLGVTSDGVMAEALMEAVER